MKTIILILMVIEIIAIFCMLYTGIKKGIVLLRNLKEKTLQRCVKDIKFRNRIATQFFFFSEMGPNVSSFSVVALLVSSEEKTWVLTIVFIFGIIMKDSFRVLKNKFYRAIDERS